MRNHNKHWVKEEDDYLIEFWGYKTLMGFCRDLGRTEKAIIKRAKILKLGSPRAMEYLTRTEVGRLLGTDYHTLKRISSLKFTKRRFKYRVFHVIKVEELMKWLENNPEKYNARNIVPYSLGYEPEWLVAKRRTDPESKAHRKWTYKDDINLTNMFKGKIPMEQIAVELKRSPKSCTRRLYRIGLKKSKGKKARPWKEEDYKLLKHLVFETDKDLTDIAIKMKRSIPAIKTKIKRVHGTCLSEIRGKDSSKTNESSVICGQIPLEVVSYGSE